VSSQHRLKPTNFRPEPNEIEPVKTSLASRQRDLDGFFRACLLAYQADPDGFMATLKPHWPPPRPRGRPRREDGEHPTP
jgi:hypothetical protein